jgi:hypothetical protein
VNSSFHYPCLHDKGGYINNESCDGQGNAYGSCLLLYQLSYFAVLAAKVGFEPTAFWFDNPQTTARRIFAMA